MSLRSLRPFGGRSLDDVIRYLRVDVASSLSQLFNALASQPAQYNETIVGTVAMNSATAQDLARLQLAPGTWDVYGSVLFTLNGATGSPVGQAWISENSRDSDGSIDGYSRMESLVQSTGRTPVYVYRRISTNEPLNIYLGIEATFASGPVQAEGSIYAIGRGII